MGGLDLKKMKERKEFCKDGGKESKKTLEDGARSDWGDKGSVRVVHVLV